MQQPGTPGDAGRGLAGRDQVLGAAPQGAGASVEVHEAAVVGVVLAGRFTSSLALQVLHRSIAAAALLMH
ncbi:MAG: hypothetical protein ACRCYU_16715 [Nocardioides sp.]